MNDDRSQALVATSRFNSMRLLVSRAVPFIDSQSLEQRTAREALFRNRDGDYVLYLSNGVGSREVEERLICLDARDALIWINEAPESSGSFWD
jgi:hypothetical protein